MREHSLGKDKVYSIDSLDIMEQWTQDPVLMKKADFNAHKKLNNKKMTCFNDS